MNSGNLKKALKSGIITITLLVATILTTQQLEVQASDNDDESQSEDDGYIIGDDDSQGEVSSQQELEETYDDTQWEDDVNNNDFEQAQQNDEEQITCPDGTVVSSGDYCPDVTTCSDGSVVAASQECPPQPQQTVDVPTALVPEPTYLPYCDEVSNEGCYDRKDTDQVTGLYPCNDGTQTADYKDCSDVTETQKDLPRCAYGVVQDCTLNDLGQTCKIGTSEDACQDVFYGWDVNGDGKINNKDKTACEKPEIAVCNDGKDNSAPAGGGPNGPPKLETIPTPQTPVPGPNYITCPDGINDGIQTSYVLVGQTCPSTSIPKDTMCKNTGLKDGKNAIFGNAAWMDCGGSENTSYYDAFISGCTYYDAFSVDYCKNFANGSIKLAGQLNQK